MNLTNSTIIPNSPTRPNLKSPKVVTPYLHQLPYISKRITSSSPRTPRLKDQETQNLSRELSRETFHNRNLSNISEVASRSSLQKYLSPKKGTLESLKSPRSRISLNFKPRESNPVVSQVAKGELMKVLPQMKLKTLRDKMLVLSKIHEKMEAEKPVASRVIDENANSRRRSIIPMDQQEYKSPPDFLENLQDCLFTFKKNKLLQVDTPADSASAIHGMSFVSPRVFNQSTRVDNPISQSQIDFKNSTIFKTPAPQSTKSKDLAASTIKLKSELEISQEASSNNVNETIFKGHHTRGHSWGHALGKLQIDEKDFGRIPTNKPYEIMSARKHNRQYSCRNLVRDAKQEMRQKSEFEKFSSQRATPVNAPSESTIKLPSVSGNLGKSTTSFNLRLDDSQKKEEGPAPSTESRKNALLSTECGSTTKRRKSFEKQKKEAEDQELDIFKLGHFIKDSAKKQPVKKEHNVSVLNMENQINLLKRSIGPKKDTSAANHSKKTQQTK